MKTIRKGMSLLFKTILLALLIAVLTPILYFAWRAAQPMELPEFKGLTYTQFTEWRVMSCKKYLDPSGCSIPGHIAADLFAAGIASTFLVIENPQMFEFVTPYNFLPTTWSMFEGITWSMNTSEAGTLKFFGSIPTPEEFETLKSEHEISAIP